MGDVLHRDVIITSYEDTIIEDRLWLDKLCAKLPKYLRRCLLGPIVGSNSLQRWFFSSSGSNKGWPLNEEHEVVCQEILKFFRYRAIMVVHGDGIETKTVIGE